MTGAKESELWQQEARRIGGEHFVAVIEDIRAGQHAILERLDTMDGRQDTAERSIADLKRAFPAGDVEGHRQYHEVQIEILRERRRLRQEIKTRTYGGLVWLALAFLGFCLLKGFSAGSDAFVTWLAHGKPE